TDLYADTTKFLCMGAVAFHQQCSEPAYLGTIQISLNAGSHHGDVLFPEAGGSAYIACGCTRVTGFNTTGIFWYQHKMPPCCRGRTTWLCQRLAASLDCAVRTINSLVILGMLFCNHSTIEFCSARIWLQTVSRCVSLV